MMNTKTNIRSNNEPALRQEPSQPGVEDSLPEDNSRDDTLLREVSQAAFREENQLEKNDELNDESQKLSFSLKAYLVGFILCLVTFAAACALSDLYQKTPLLTLTSAATGLGLAFTFYKLLRTGREELKVTACMESEPAFHGSHRNHK